MTTPAADNTPTPRAVVLEALLHPLPDTAGPEDRAGLIVAALIEYGHVVDPHQPSQGDVEDTARALAEASGHPRYTHSPEAWRLVLASEADLTVAYTAAVRRGAVEAQVLNGWRARILAAGRR